MENELPKSGLIVTPSSMAEAIAEGRKTILVKTKSYDIADREMLLLDRNKALAIIRVGEQQELDGDSFDEHEQQHLITREIRKDWSEAQPSWEEGPFYQWPIEVIEKFDEPIETDIEMSPTVVVEDVDIDKRGAFGRYGSSGMYAKWLVGQLPEHKKYVEPFCGAASVFFTKEPSETDVLSDYDSEVVNALKALKGLTDEQLKCLSDKDRVLGRDKWKELRSSVPSDSLERLHRLLYLSGGGWSSSIISYRKHKEGKDAYDPNRLKKYRERLNKGKVLIEYSDWKATIKKHDSKDTLFFIDCPYPGEWDKKADDIADDDPKRGEKISLEEYGKVLKGIKGSFVFVLGDHKEHIEFMKGLDGVTLKTFTGTEAASLGGVKTAKRYFAFKIAACNKKPKKKSFDEVETDAIEFLEVTEDQNIFAGLDLTPELEPTDFSDHELVEIHKRLHAMYEDPPEGWTTTDVVSCHSLVVDEVYARKNQHPAPPDNGLDDISYDFEHFALQQPRWFETVKAIDCSTPKTKNPKKSGDIYTQSPEGSQPFTVQHHWVGKSMSSILRIGVVPSRRAIGWCLDTQRAEISEPVTTLVQSREITKRASEFYKINWLTGKWATKKKSESEIELPIAVICKKLPTSTYAWLDIEGKTMDPKPGAPAPLGGSTEYPGVFEIVEKGTAEFGAQTNSLHEYFLKGSNFSGRTLFREMKIRKSTEGNCQVCGVEAAIDIGWTDESGVKLCQKCYRKQNTDGVEKSILPQITDDLDVSLWVVNVQDSTPYVLSEKAVGDEWMPSDGVSALPSKIKEQVPSEYEYWNEAGIDAREMRDSLVKAIQEDVVSIDFDATFKSDDSISNARFVLQKQAWVDDANPVWFIRLDTGKPNLNVIELHSDPLEDEKIKALVLVEKYKSSMEIDGDLSGAHYLNTRKGLRSTLTKIDSGTASIVSETEETTQVEFNGNLLKGLYVLNRSDNGYLLEKDGGDPIAEIEKMVNFELVLPIDYFEIQKAGKGKEKRLVTGIVLEPDMIDAQDDTIKATAIEKSAHLFLSKYNKETKLGLMHSTFGDIGIELCQSFIAPVDYSVGKKKVKKGSWVMTVHVTDDSRWYDIKNRKLTGFSIGGKARMARKQ